MAPACPWLSSLTAGIHRIGRECDFQGWQALGNWFFWLPLPFRRQWLLSALHWFHRLLVCYLYPGLAGNGIILRHQISYFYFITIIIAAKEDKSRVLSSPWKTYIWDWIPDGHFDEEKGSWSQWWFWRSERYTHWLVRPKHASFFLFNFKYHLCSFFLICLFSYLHPRSFDMTKSWLQF